MSLSLNVYARVKFRWPSRICSHCCKNYHSTSQLLTTKDSSNNIEKKNNEKEGLSEESKTTQVRRRIKRFLFKEFLAQEGKLYEMPKFNGPNYLGSSNCPFPMNPYFKAQPPLSDTFKEVVWDMFMQGITIREIGTKMGISLKRVEAILKLKKLEKDMIAQGLTIQRSFSSHMEKMLGARSILSEELSDTLPQVGKPKFYLRDEGEAFKPEDAANILKRPTLAILEERKLREELVRPFSLEEKTNELQGAIEIERNEDLKNKRFAFRFKNVGKNPGIVIRERDGSLLKVENTSIGKSIHFTN
ncbi:16758_t:CDS:2 [Acaulospora morrowiae]|uniref:16758_t:CDS:1 n=1 Tax=Acaulospora morrowiae TaxID=94023 RepID=A0A9N9D4P0_9GLOM|nr:16758_t:CDS:2 [Acaulospora morrowiae]